MISCFRMHIKNMRTAYKTLYSVSNKTCKGLRVDMGFLASCVLNRFMGFNHTVGRPKKNRSTVDGRTFASGLVDISRFVHIFTGFLMFYILFPGGPS